MEYALMQQPSHILSVASPGKDLELMMGDGLANALWDLIRTLSHRNLIPVNLRQSRHSRSGLFHISSKQYSKL